MMPTFRRCLEALAERLPARRLYGGSGLDLSRYTVAKLGLVRVYLHEIHRGDEDPELHDHPWRFALAWILAGGYTEERRHLEGWECSVRSRTFRPGQINRIEADTFHRVDAVLPGTWTLFVVGPRVQDWSFWNRRTGQVTPWRDFLAAKGVLVTADAPGSEP